jgi:hypothetical protein
MAETKEESQGRKDKLTVRRALSGGSRVSPLGATAKVLVVDVDTGVNNVDIHSLARVVAVEEFAVQREVPLRSPVQAPRGRAVLDRLGGEELDLLDIINLGKGAELGDKVVIRSDRVALERLKVVEV